jgi:hypothetical protein
MKAIRITLIVTLTCLGLAACQCLSFKGKSLFPGEYVIMVPPSNANKGPHVFGIAEVQNQLEAHAKQYSLIFPKGLNIIPDAGVNHPKAGIVAVSASLFPKQVENLAKTFTFTLPGKKKVKAIIGLSRKYRPAASQQSGDPGIRSAGSWASDAVVGLAPPNKIPLANNRTPVLYVVDTGVLTHMQSLNNFHKQLPIGTGVNQAQVLQGQVPQGVGAGTSAWPPATSTDPAVWATAIYDSQTGLPNALNLGATDYLRSTNPSAALSPYRDTVGHGTKIASTALSSFVGFMGRTDGAKVNVQSIRVYNSSNTYTADAIDGIALAIESHKARGAGAASVLLFASRTTSGFDPNLEVALWWAWHEGIVCVVAGGNTPAAYRTNPTKYSPDSLWYTSPNSTLPTPQPTSPSRFDWVEANAHPEYWPAWQDAPNGNPYPNRSYLIVVGGSNATSATPTADNWASGSSKGPDIDIIAPFTTPPVAKTTASSLYSSNDCLVNNASGTSFSAGYVAGYVLACLANASSNPTPNEFRDWLFPPNGPPNPNAPLSSAAAASGHYWHSSYNGMIPKLKASTAYP